MTNNIKFRHSSHSHSGFLLSRLQPDVFTFKIRLVLRLLWRMDVGALRVAERVWLPLSIMVTHLGIKEFLGIIYFVYYSTICCISIFWVGWRHGAKTLAEVTVLRHTLRSQLRAHIITNWRRVRQPLESIDLSVKKSGSILIIPLAAVSTTEIRLALVAYLRILVLSCPVSLANLLEFRNIRTDTVHSHGAYCRNSLIFGYLVLQNWDRAFRC